MGRFQDGCDRSWLPPSGFADVEEVGSVISIAPTPLPPKYHGGMGVNSSSEPTGGF